MSELLNSLDHAADEMLKKAMASDDIESMLETFKVVANWAERRNKLDPPKSKPQESPFSAISGRLTPGGGAPKRRRATAAPTEAQPDLDTDPDA